MIEVREQIEKVANSIPNAFTVKDVREILDWENTTSIDARIRNVLNTLDLHKEIAPWTNYYVYSHSVLET